MAILDILDSPQSSASSSSDPQLSRKCQGVRVSIDSSAAAAKFEDDDPSSFRPWDDARVFSSCCLCLYHLTWFHSTITCPCEIITLVLITIIIIESKKLKLLQRKISRRSTRIMVQLPPKRDYPKKLR
ncbi:hypothetical protein F3Y22_tig00110610pilonHSYRG00830 [Hibiscus syriacus]|uniref:Uncharacterized protein n=1 Tax=Hibiscus syriacus TaxID=106335 RepID=A0A6A3A1H0_HIBSY|nr:hypothetical protein F3Y22_tig00110610pilonHSYRG00830 [Hibiscus syriacus]